MLKVTVYNRELDAPIEELDVDFVSLINGGTYGPPPLIGAAEKSGGTSTIKASEGERVLYINTSLVPAFEIEKVD